MTTISVTVVDDDPGEADRLSRDLRTELLALDVDRADLELDSDVPPGAKADAGTIVTIIVALSGSPVLVQLGKLLRDWVNRANGRKIVVRDGDRSLALTGTSAEDNREVIEAFFGTLGDPMAFIRTVTGDEATGLTNYARTFAHRPEVYRAWEQLNAAIKSNMDLRRYELATVAAAVALRSSYCALAHGNVLAERFLSPEGVIAVVTDRAAAPLDDVDRAVMAFAEKVALNADRISQEDVDELAKHGLTDQDILDVVLAAAGRCFFSKTLDATGTVPDAEYQKVEPRLRDALTVGRAIE